MTVTQFIDQLDTLKHQGTWYVKFNGQVMQRVNGYYDFTPMKAMAYHKGIVEEDVMNQGILLGMDYNTTVQVINACANSNSHSEFRPLLLRKVGLETVRSRILKGLMIFVNDIRYRSA